MNRQFLFSSYTPVGDIIVISICFVMLILISFSYVRKTRSFKIFLGIIGLLILACNVDVSFYVLATAGKPRWLPVAYGLRCVYHALLFAVFVLYIQYICEVTGLEKGQRRLYTWASLSIFAVVVAMDVIETSRGMNFRITEAGIEFQGRDLFIYGYLAFVALVIALMVQVRKRLFKRVMMGFYTTIGISLLVQLTQRLFSQSSFTVSTFLFPAVGMLYLMHSNPYNAELGAVDIRAMEDLVRHNLEKDKSFLFLSLYLKDYDEEGKQMPETLQATVRRFTTDYFRGALLFQVGNGHVILLVPMARNADYEHRVEMTLKAFAEEYKRFRLDYKIVIGTSIREISSKNEYISFIRNINRSMKDNTVHHVSQEDVRAFNRYEFILRELEDIHHKHDLEDTRVMVYAQPVYNLVTHQFDTAEALMRLRLDQLGIVQPYEFITLAEEYGYIHVLTEIILNKTCREVRKLAEAGYQINRVSVNVSMLELKEEAFCDDIGEILDRSGVESSRIAIELTESQNEADFILMKDKISRLKTRGIKFYLDDFGTGYSNMERIMELPFDIIKFDRSMVIASGSSDRLRKIVGNLAHMFAGMDYAVLYEGVEDESDEHRCELMAASYLQGYRYSRPMPIAELKNFLAKSA